MNKRKVKQETRELRRIAITRHEWYPGNEDRGHWREVDYTITESLPEYGNDGEEPEIDGVYFADCQGREAIFISKEQWPKIRREINKMLSNKKK